jgi:hypothetical protein
MRRALFCWHVEQRILDAWRRCASKKCRQDFVERLQHGLAAILVADIDEHCSEPGVGRMGDGVLNRIRK